MARLNVSVCAGMDGGVNIDPWQCGVTTLNRPVCIPRPPKTQDLFGRNAFDLTSPTIHHIQPCRIGGPSAIYEYTLIQVRMTFKMRFIDGKDAAVQACRYK